jgi:TolB-like protein
MIRLFPILFIHFIASNLWAQTTSPTPKKPNIAVLNFSGDATVTPEQLAFITGEFASELTRSEAFTVLERSRMKDILQEQNFQQSEICNSSECKLQMGQMLGVDNLVVGSMVRFGPNYAFRVEYLDVATGVILKTVSFEKTGELHQVYRTACQEGASALGRFANGLPDSVTTPSSTTPVVSSTYKRPGWKFPVLAGLALGGVVCGVAGLLEHQNMTAERKTYNNADYTGRPVTEANAQWDKVVSAESARNILWSAGAGLLAAGLVVQFAF